MGVTRAANALDSLYGKKSALAGNVGAPNREQEVLTPDWIVDAAREALGGTIEFDPCASSDPLKWFAECNVTLPENSLELDWSGTAIYCNPPYAELQPWLEKCGAAARCKEPARVVFLGPFRPHRSWFLPALRGSEIVFLHYAVKFQGHTSAFPAPLFLASWNCTIPDLGARETGRWRP